MSRGNQIKEEKERNTNNNYSSSYTYVNIKQ
jgi:hypothetical protein